MECKKGRDEIRIEIIRIATQVPFPIDTQVYEISVYVFNTDIP